MKTARILLPMLLAVTGCSHHATITYPRLPEVGEREAALDCAGIDRSIARTDTVRWVMREDGAHLLTGPEIFGRRTVEAAGIFSPPFILVPVVYEGHFALNDIERRLRDLLALKRDKSCGPSLTAHPGMTDLQLLDRLTELMDSADKSGSERRRLDERTRLLDGLRAVD